MNIRIAEIKDMELLSADCHISRHELENSVKLKRVYIAEKKGVFAGWLRYNLFWDNTPFMNMLYILEDFRGKGYGRVLVENWEMDMLKLSFDTVMTSTASNEYAQHFYVKLGYKAIGGFTLFEEPLELIFAKKLCCPIDNC